jgi:hypothetical protein
VHVHSIEHLVSSQLIDDMTEWDGKKPFNVISLSLPKQGEMESQKHKQARDIVQAWLQKSFGCKWALD